MKAAIRKVTEADAQAICGIYNHYVTDTVVTFEQDPVSVPDMGARSYIHAACSSQLWVIARSQTGILPSVRHVNQFHRNLHPRAHRHDGRKFGSARRCLSSIALLRLQTSTVGPIC